jgi:hypothetical protein
MEQRVRRPVESGESPEEREGRRGCMLLGGMMGIAIGALVAFFVVPPLMSHYFGTADVALGKAYEGDGQVLTVVDARHVAGPDGAEYPGLFEVVLEVRSNKTWQVGPETFELELTTGGEKLRALPADDSRPETRFDFALGAERQLVLRFPGTERRDARPETLHVEDPRVRVHLTGDSGK